MNSLSHLTSRFFLAILSLLLCTGSRADLPSAISAMEDAENPLLLISTARGEIYVELFPREAPQNVANIIALAQGEIEFTDEISGLTSAARYYNGMRFHRVIPGILIQTGSALYNPAGAPARLIDDEINADLLGLDQEAVLLVDGKINPLLNIANKEQFDQSILAPLYKKLGINDVSELEAQQQRVLSALQSLSVKEVYESRGYDYTTQLPGRGVSVGSMALANSGPNSNGAEFFISLGDAHWLNGKHTVIGQVVDGMNAIELIAATAIDAEQYSSLSTLIYSIRLAN